MENEANNTLNEMVADLGMIPVTSSNTTTILLDISLFPREYKDLGDLETTLKAYEDRFNVKVVPIDTSRKNLEGNSTIIAQIIK